MIKNQWYAIASSKEIKKNQLFSLKRLNMNLVLFKDNHNNINALIDKCSHRGAALSKGKVKNCIQCPFHGLEFNGDGNCEKIPALGNFSKDNLKRFNIQNFLVKEQNEIIYIWYGNNKVSSEIPFFEELKDDNFSMKEMTDIWNTHYSRAIENQLDVIHLPFIHHNTIGRGKYMNNIVQKQDKRVVITQNPKKSELKIKENLLQGDLPIIEYRKIRNILQKGEFYE